MGFSYIECVHDLVATGRKFPGQGPGIEALLGVEFGAYFASIGALRDSIATCSDRYLGGILLGYPVGFGRSWHLKRLSVFGLRLQG